MLYVQIVSFGVRVKLIRDVDELMCASWYRPKILEQIVFFVVRVKLTRDVEGFDVCLLVYNVATVVCKATNLTILFISQQNIYFGSGTT